MVSILAVREPVDDLCAELGLPPDAHPDAVRAAYRRFASNAVVLLTVGDVAARKRFDAVTRLFTAWDSTDTIPPRRTPRGSRPIVDPDRSTLAMDSTRARRGADVESVLRLTWGELRAGCTKQLEIARARRCQGCRGAGRRAVPPCAECRDGTLVVVEQVEVVVPAGIPAEAVLRIVGKGDESVDAEPGHLHVRLDVDRLGFLIERGHDVIYEVAVGRRQVWFGGEIEIATLDGPAVVEFPRGARDGAVMRLSGKGLLRDPAGQRDSGDLSRGDQIVVFRVPGSTWELPVVVLGVALVTALMVVALLGVL